MKLHSVFLRTECILPDGMDPLREPCGANWTLADEITAPDFYTVIRQRGWRFAWSHGSCFRRGLGHTQETATANALARALKGIARRFNAAELVDVQITKVAGFHIAKVTLEPREVQQYSSLDFPAVTHPRASSRDKPSVTEHQGPALSRVHHPHRYRATFPRRESNLRLKRGQDVFS